MTRLADWLLALHGVGVYLLVGLLVFAEDALFIGFLLPGETAAILGGVAASRGHVALLPMIAVVVGAAILGDSAGYEVGRHFGPRLLSTRPLRRREQRIDAARDLLARRGGTAVFLGRFVAFLRAVMPALAGAAHMPYRTFLAFNAAGGLVSGIGTVVLGYLAGNSYSTIEKTFGRATALIILAIAVVAVITWWIRRHTAQRHSASAPREPDGRAHDTD